VGTGWGDRSNPVMVGAAAQGHGHGKSMQACDAGKGHD